MSFREALQKISYNEMKVNKSKKKEFGNSKVCPLLEAAYNSISHGYVSL